MKSKNNSNELPGSSDVAQDLDWLAFCYVADELDAAAKAEFEERLLTDVEACEAVADAVQLNSLVCQACDESQPQTQVLELADVGGSDKGNWSFTPALVFAASILLCLFAASWIWNDVSPGGDDSFELASTWAESLADEPTELVNGNSELSIVLNSAEVLDTSGDSESDMSWMLVALADMEVNN